MPMQPKNQNAVETEMKAANEIVQLLLQQFMLKGWKESIRED